MSRVTAAQLEALGYKYLVLADLLEEREIAISRGLTEFPEAERPRRRRTMKELAEQFPGSLRELEEFTVAELEARRDVLEHGQPAPWKEAAVLFHWALREALQMRRGSLREPTYWQEPFVSRELRAQVLAPPSGRVLDVVWTAVARELGITPRAAELLVYPKAPPRGARV